MPVSHNILACKYNTKVLYLHSISIISLSICTSISTSIIS